MKEKGSVFSRVNNRRSFLKNGIVAAGATTMGAALLPATAAAFGREEEDHDHAPITKGDIAILTFLSALEQVEADLWIQYVELGGATNQGLSPIDLELNGQKIATGLAPAYVTGLQVLDGDMPQYIADNTDDEISHHRFLNNYLASKGAKTIDLSQFAILPPESGKRRSSKRQVYEPEAIDRGHELVDALPQRDSQPRPRGTLRERRPRPG